MKQLFYISTIFSLLFIFNSGCSFNEEEDSKIIDAHSCSIAITGMMCEKGCKTTIQNKLSEMEGVIKVSVDYELAKAFVTYDHNKVNTEQLIDKIGSLVQGIYSGQLIEDSQVDLDPENNNTENESSSKSVRSFSFELPDITRMIPRLF